MEEKLKQETAVPAEVSDEALDQVNGGKTNAFGSMTAGISIGVNDVNGFQVAKFKIADK